MTKILFVCHGNICRSPMAQFIFQDLAQKAGIAHKFHVVSRAVSAEELGNPVYPPARRELEKHDIACPNHRATVITAKEVEEFDRIYYMDSRNARYLQRLFPGQTKFQPLLNRDVADPYYCGGFDRTWQDIYEGCKKILEELQ